jgi:hypothetical protein
LYRKCEIVPRKEQLKEGKKEERKEKRVGGRKEGIVVQKN